MERFSEFAKENIFLDGDKTKIDDVLNQEIEVVDYRIKDSKFSKNNSGKYLAIQFKRNGDQLQIIFTGSDVLIEQMEKYSDHIPFLVTIKKINRYYTFS